MKRRFCYTPLIFSFLFFINSFGNFAQTGKIKAYLLISFQTQKYQDSLSQFEIEKQIKNIFTGEGISVFPGEKPDIYEDHKLYVDITVKDSLIINARSVSVDLSVYQTIYPRFAASYRNKSDIYLSVKKFIKANLL
jgi:hypothetical protein